MTIALAATVIARFYGFGHYLSSHQTWTQSIVLLLVFIAMSVPLGFSLTRIAGETVTASKVRSFLSDKFGSTSRVTQMDIDFDREPISIRAVVIAPRSAAANSASLQKGLAAAIGRPLKLQVDQVLMSPGAGAMDAQRAELQQVSAASVAENAEVASVTRLVALGAGVSPDDVIIDRDHHRVTATAIPLPGATTETYRALEQRVRTAADGWQVSIVPPLAAFPDIRFDGATDTLDDAARDAVLLSAWEAKRWNIVELGVPGLPKGEPPLKPSLIQRRALAIAALLNDQGVKVVPAPSAGPRIVLAPAQGSPVQ